MLKYLKLKNVGPSPTMEIHLKSRMNILTGDNGLGKTFLLDIAWWALTQTWARMPVIPPTFSKTESFRIPWIHFKYRSGSGPKSFVERASFYSRSRQTWSVGSRRPFPGLVIYSQVDGGLCVWDEVRNYSRGRSPERPERPPAYRFKPEEVWDGLPRDNPKKHCNGLIADWASWQRENGEPFSQLTRVLARLSSSPEEPVKPGKLMRIGMDDTRDQPSLLLPYKKGVQQTVPLVFASAGIRRIVALAYLLVWTWQEHLRACEIRGMKPAKDIMFLIDEIEAHLHPQWQRRIVKALLEVMKALTGTHTVSVQMIATTHSPLVLASTEPYFEVEKDAIWELDLVKEKVELKEFPFSRLGDVNQWLTSGAFDLREPRSLEAEEAITKALSLAKAPTPSKREINEVDRLLRNALSDVDRFWVRWTEFRRNREAAR